MSEPSVIFLVHGMGEHKDGWEKDAIKTLRKAYQSSAYPNLQGTFDGNFVVKPLSYDAVFEPYRKAWQEGPKKILDLMAGDPGFKKSIKTAERKKLLEDIKKSVKKLESEGEFFWKYLLDVLLYRFSLEVRSKVHVTVANQLLKGLNEAQGVQTNWAVVAHSLGTAVTHNVLHALYEQTPPNALIHDPATGSWPEKKLREGTGTAKLSPGSTRPLFLAMLSNVSKLLELPDDELKVYKTLVRPGKVSEGTLCAKYLNINHKYDPFAYFRPYSPDRFNGNLSSTGADRLISVTPEIIKDKNTHGLDHYLADPAVHVALFRAFFNKDIVSKTELKHALEKHAQGGLADIVSDLRGRLNGMKPSPEAGIETFLDSVKKFAELV